MTEPEKKPPLAAVKNMAAERNKVLVTKLEEFVQLAKDGHVSDLAIICKVRGESFTEFNWDSASPLELLGALEMAKAEVVADLLDEVDEPPEDDED